MASRNRSSKAFSGNHQRSWLWGKHAVLETLTVGRWPVLEVYCTEEAWAESAALFGKLVATGVPVHFASRARLEELSKSSEHQGLLARLGAYVYSTMEELRLSLSQASGYPIPLIVMCDRIQDTFNFGAILRCCDGAQVTAVIVGQRSQAAMTPHVIRSSSGAANYVPVVQASDLDEAVRSLKALGATIVAADSNAHDTMWSSNLRGFNLLILGSESVGVAPELLAMCDLKVTIPMGGHIDSLNVAVAAGVLVYEMRRQQIQQG